jgi:hypothetical protein
MVRGPTRSTRHHPWGGMLLVSSHPNSCLCGLTQDATRLVLASGFYIDLSSKQVIVTGRPSRCRLPMNSWLISRLHWALNATSM